MVQTQTKSYLITALRKKVMQCRNCIHSALVAVLVLLILSGCVAPNLVTERFKFYFRDVSQSDAAVFAKAMEEGSKRVEEVWGKTFTGTMRVKVRSRYRMCTALVQAWNEDRGRMKFAADKVSQGNAATIHEIVHVFAPNQSRFLAEGLAVYFHHLLGGNPAYPNFGKDLSHMARDVSHLAHLAELDAISTPERLEIPGQIDERSAYILAGSFVGFLIETYSLYEFTQVYGLTPLLPRQRSSCFSPARYSAVFGKRLDALEQEWREWLFR